MIEEGMDKVNINKSKNVEIRLVGITMKRNINRKQDLHFITELVINNEK